MKLVVLDHDFPERCSLERQLLSNTADGYDGKESFLTCVKCPNEYCPENATLNGRRRIPPGSCYERIIAPWERAFGSGTTVHYRNGSYYGWLGRGDVGVERVKFINLRRTDETDRTGP